MRKIFFVLFLAGFAAACGNNSGDQRAEQTKEASAPENAPADADAQKGLALVGKSDCLTCHKIDEPSTGPSYMSVSERYAGKEAEVRDSLANKIIKGGVGNWGPVPMIAHPSISPEDARLMVHYVLSLKK